MLEHRYDIRISESYVDPKPLMVKIKDPDNFTFFQTRERCALEIAAYVFKDRIQYLSQHMRNGYVLHRREVVLQIFQGQLHCGARCPNCVISVHLDPFFVYTSSEYSFYCAHVNEFARTFFSGNCTKQQYLICWHILVRLHVTPS